MTTLLIPRGAKLGQGFTPAEQREAAFHPGRRTDGTQSAATWIADLTDARKLITLCGFCARHFNPKKHGFRRWYVPDHTGATSGYAVSGQCDGCKTKLIANGVSFLPEEHYALVCIDPITARREARQRARAARPEWTAFNRRDSRRSLVAAAKGA